MTARQNETLIEVEEFDNEASYAGSIAESETTSVASSVLAYVYENGRRYTNYRDKKGYMLPNDDLEQERLDLVHHYYTVMLHGELYHAPLKNIKLERALDLGTGTGIWAVDFADQHPTCQVKGIDLSPIQPVWVPDNCTFEVDDFEAEWTNGKKYDYIHGRTLMGSVKDWPALIKQAYDNLSPGGYIELIETDLPNAFSEDGSLDGGPVEAFHIALKEAGLKLGNRFDLVPELGTFLEQAGFTDIKKERFKCPMGPWPKDPHYKKLGQIGYQISITGFEAYGLALFINVLGWEEQRARQLVEDCVKSLGSRKTHMLYPVYNFIARKPLDC